MQTEYSILGYRVGLYFHDYKLAIEVDEFGHTHRSINYEIQRKKQYRKSLVVNLLKLILMNKISILKFKAINKIHRHIKQSSKKSLIDKIQKDY